VSKVPGEFANTVAASVTCTVCSAASNIRFCSYACLETYSRGRPGVECAVCQWDLETGRVGNANTDRLCGDCSSAEENRDWCAPSDYEQSAEDVDVAAVAAGGGVRMEVMFGGRRKADTALADEVIRAARYALVSRRRRRRSADGRILRGWQTVMEPATEREIAELAGCSRAYVRKLLGRLNG
jgi:hypothetical protein